MMKNVREFLGEEEYEARMAAAREVAEWELGDSSWAAMIVGAFLYPVETKEGLAAEMAEAQN